MRRAAALALVAGLAGCAASAAPPETALPPPPAPTRAPPASASASATGSASAPVASASAPPAGDEHPPDDPDGDGELADDAEGMDVGLPSPAADSPLLELSDAELFARFKKDKASLGALSVGSPAMGLLVSGVPMPEGDAWILTDPHAAFGTEETIQGIKRGADAVRAAFPHAHPLVIGHLSAKSGGPLSPHRSHQSGRDVDLGFFHKGDPPRGLKVATAQNLDPAATWLFLKTVVQSSAVEFVFLDSRVQKMLADHAIAAGEDAKLVDELFLFRNKNPRAPVRHLHGHHNHFHIRFHSPNSVALARRLSRVLPRPSPRKPPQKHGPQPKPGVAYVEIRARSGDNLQAWAKRFNTTVEELQRLNGLSGTALKIGHVYKVPKPGKLLRGDLEAGLPHAVEQRLGVGFVVEVRVARVARLDLGGDAVGAKEEGAGDVGDAGRVRAGDVGLLVLVDPDHDELLRHRCDALVLEDRAVVGAVRAPRRVDDERDGLPGLLGLGEALLRRAPGDVRGAPGLLPLRRSPRGRGRLGGHRRRLRRLALRGRGGLVGAGGSLGTASRHREREDGDGESAKHEGAEGSRDAAAREPLPRASADGSS